MSKPLCFGLHVHPASSPVHNMDNIARLFAVLNKAIATGEDVESGMFNPDTIQTMYKLIYMVEKEVDGWTFLYTMLLGSSKSLLQVFMVAAHKSDKMALSVVAFDVFLSSLDRLATNTTALLSLACNMIHICHVVRNYDCVRALSLSAKQWLVDDDFFTDSFDIVIGESWLEQKMYSNAAEIIVSLQVTTRYIHLQEYAKALLTSIEMQTLLDAYGNPYSLV
jgi:hypothetical protein